MRTERAGLGSYESVRPEDKITGEDTYQSAARKKLVPLTLLLQP